jgi:hypothetical protein
MAEHGISQRSRDGRSVAYHFDNVYRATFTDCECAPRSLHLTFPQSYELDHAADAFLDRSWTPDGMVQGQSSAPMFVWDCRS